MIKEIFKSRPLDYFTRLTVLRLESSCFQLREYGSGVTAKWRVQQSSVTGVVPCRLREVETLETGARQASIDKYRQSSVPQPHYNVFNEV